MIAKLREFSLLQLARQEMKNEIDSIQVTNETFQKLLEQKPYFILAGKGINFTDENIDGISFTIKSFEATGVEKEFEIEGIFRAGCDTFKGCKNPVKIKIKMKGNKIFYFKEMRFPSAIVLEADFNEFVRSVKEIYKENENV